MIDRYVKQQARDTITQNAARDKANVRYARVPSKTKSYDSGCPFCQMLASRGFVYYSEKTAGGKSKLKQFGAYHDDCGCVPVPSFEAQRVELEGYDPQELYRFYLENLRGRFNGKRSKIFSGSNAKTYPQNKSPFGSIYDMCQYLRASKTLAELKSRCETVEKYWNSNVYSDKYWLDVCGTVNDIRSKLIA